MPVHMIGGTSSRGSRGSPLLAAALARLVAPRRPCLPWRCAAAALLLPPCAGGRPAAGRRGRWRRRRRPACRRPARRSRAGVRDRASAARRRRTSRRAAAPRRRRRRRGAPAALSAERPGGLCGRGAAAGRPVAAAGVRLGCASRVLLLFLHRVHSAFWLNRLSRRAPEAPSVSNGGLAWSRSLPVCSPCSSAPVTPDIWRTTRCVVATGTCRDE